MSGPITRPDTPFARKRAPRTTKLPRLARVLIVDDDPLVLSATRRILSKDHDVVCAMGAPIALTLLRSGVPEFDALVCGVFMSRMNGKELHAAMLEFSPRLAQRMIFVDHDLDCPRAREFLDTVPNMRLEKPIDFGELRASIRACGRFEPGTTA